LRQAPPDGGRGVGEDRARGVAAAEHRQRGAYAASAPILSICSSEDRLFRALSSNTQPGRYKHCLNRSHFFILESNWTLYSRFTPSLGSPESLDHVRAVPSGADVTGFPHAGGTVKMSLLQGSDRETASLLEEWDPVAVGPGTGMYRVDSALHPTAAS
jgi:hypothetical protein